jgi:hypothetical protein
MAADNGTQQEVLEGNVGRLFDRLKSGPPMAVDARTRILERLLQETQPSRWTFAGFVVRRGVRWAGLAAGLLVAAALLTGHRDQPAKLGSSTVVKGAGSVARESPTDVTGVRFAIHLLASGPGLGVVEAASLEGGEPVRIHSERQVSNVDVESARVVRTASACQVSIRLTEEGTGKLARFTRNHIGERLALVLDGKVAMTPTIRSEIAQGDVALTGDFTDARCQEIARALSARN